MRNLLNRLKPEIKAELEESAQNHPDFIQRMYENLEKKKYYRQLTIEEIGDIHSFADIHLAKTSVWDMRFGENLFEAE